MEDRSRVVLGMLVGAAVGGVVGFLLYTESGRRLRSGLRPQLEGIVDEAKWLRGTVDRIREVASDGWESVSEFFADAGEENPWATSGQANRRS